MAQHNFRVIVIGAGVAGLTASHCLQKAGIDHIVLERGEIAPAEGASIAIYPHGGRILSQLGVHEAAKKAVQPLQRFKNRGPDGKVLVDSGFFDYVKENHGEDILLLERREFLQILWDGLPDQSFVKTGRKVTAINDTPECITVETADGIVEKGDMVIGADGVHSLVRNMMWDYANKVQPSLITAQEKASISTSWECLIGMSGPTDMGGNDMTVVHNDKYSILILNQDDKTFFFVFFSLANPTRWPNRKRFTQEDADAAAAKVADHVVSDTLCFQDIYKKRVRSAYISLEEGILKHWHFGRTVLAGDAAHKITPNIALGGNSSMESIVVLCNRLQAGLKRHKGAKPSRAALGEIFEAYQKERIPRMKRILDYSSLITRLQAWDNALFKIAANWIVPYAPDRLVADDLGKIIREAPKLSYVPVPASFRKGSVIWADEMEAEVPAASTKQASTTAAARVQAPQKFVPKLATTSAPVIGTLKAEHLDVLLKLTTAMLGVLTMLYLLIKA